MYPSCTSNLWKKQDVSLCSRYSYTLFSLYLNTLYWTVCCKCAQWLSYWLNHILSDIGVTGQHIAKLDDSCESGEGTYTRQGQIYSSLAGSLKVTAAQDKGKVIVHANWYVCVSNTVVSVHLVLSTTIIFLDYLWSGKTRRKKCCTFNWIVSDCQSKNFV